MPLYEYKCASCGKTFEVIQKFADEPLKTHPECGGLVERLFSAPAFHLKGTGWYATDYAKKSNGSDSKSKEGDSKSGDSKSKDGDSKSESSPKTEATSSNTENKPAAPPTSSSSETKPSTPS